MPSVKLKKNKEVKKLRGDNIKEKKDRTFRSKYEEKMSHDFEKLSKNKLSSSSISIKQKIEKDKRDKMLEKRSKGKFKKKFENNDFIQKITKRKIKLINKLNIGILLIPIIFLVLIFAFLQTKVFDVHNIIIKQNKYVDALELKKYIQNNGGNGLIFNISPARLKNSIEQSFGFIKSVDISKDLPSSLTFSLHEYDPLAILKTKTNAYLVSTEGVILLDNIDAEALKTQYPVIGIDKDVKYQIKSKFDPNIIMLSLKAMDLAKGVSPINNFVITLYADGSADATTAFTDNRNWTMTLTKKDLLSQYIILKQVGTLQKYKTLDTRFAGSYIIN